MKKSIVLSLFLFVSGLFLPVCQAQSPWTGCVSDSRYPSTKYKYTVEQVGTGSTAYATIRGTVINTTASQDAFPGTMDGYIESSTSKIHFTIGYRNNWGTRFYVIDRSGNGISWAVGASGAIYAQPQTVTIQNCSTSDESSNPGEFLAYRPPFPCESCSPLGRWCDNKNGTVTDKATGLIWLKDASWGGQHNWSDAANRAAQVRSGNPTSLTDGSQAGQWRVPTKDELVALTTGDEAIRSSSPYLFTGVQSGGYWSGTTYAGSTDGAWVVYLGNGYVYWYGKATGNYVWPVRGGQ